MKNNDGRYSALAFTLFVTALGATYLVSGCNHAPLGGRKPDAQPSTPSVTVVSTSTSTDTDTAIDAPATVSPPASSPQDECDKRMGYWDATTNSCRDTQPETKPTTATSTGTATSTAVDASVDDSTKTMTDTSTGTITQIATNTAGPRVPVITSVDVQKVNAQGKFAEDTRRFVIGFNGPAVDIRLKVIEPLSGAVVTDSPVIANGSKYEPVVANLDRTLKSDTTYSFEVSARSPDSAFVQGWTGEFKTAYCFIGEWKYHYTPDASTDGIGKCHGAMMQCVDNGHGDGMLSGAGEVTPYPWGDIMDNGIDDDCNGIVDDGAYFCPVNNSTISQGCCMPQRSEFPRPSLSDLKHQPNAYTLVKGGNSFVYLYAADGKRYVFTNKDVITSWFTSFDGGVLGQLVNVCNTVNELSDVELASIMIGGNVTVRPGSYIVKIASDPALYVVAKGKVLRRLASVEMAEKLYPGTSAQRIRVIPDAFFTNYFVGKQVTDVSDYDPAKEWSSANLETEAAVK